MIRLANRPGFASLSRVRDRQPAAIAKDLEGPPVGVSMGGPRRALTKEEFNLSPAKGIASLRPPSEQFDTVALVAMLLQIAYACFFWTNPRTKLPLTQGVVAPSMLALLCPLDVPRWPTEFCPFSGWGMTADPAREWK